MREYLRQPLGEEERLQSYCLISSLDLALFPDRISIFKQITPTTEH